MTAQRRRTATILGAIVLITSGLILFTQPIPQPLSYHEFADTRSIVGLNNGINVLSNLAFAVVGLVGIFWLIQRQQQLSDLLPIYAVFFVGLILVGAGSAYYHIAPDNPSLVWDRLPMSACFMSLFSLVIAERIDLKLGKTLLPWLLTLGITSVLYWQWWDDLRPYLLVQFGTVLLLPIIIWHFRGSGTLWLWLVLVFYLVAKAAEIYDGELYQLTNRQLSGHTLKHIAAAAGAFMLALKVRYT